MCRPHPMAPPSVSQVVLLLSAWCVAAASADSDDVEITPFRSAPFADLNATSYSGIVHSTGRRYTAHLGVVQDAARFTIELPPNGCAVRHNVSEGAALYNCELATNGGFFAFTPPACLNNLVINSSVLQYPGSDAVNMAVSLETKRVIIGYISAATHGQYKTSSLLQGNGFLVRNGKSYVNSSREFPNRPWNDSFVMEKAPRTAIGVANDGAVVVMVVDGVETEALGLSLYEFAEVWNWFSAGPQAAVDLAHTIVLCRHERGVPELSFPGLHGARLVVRLSFHACPNPIALIHLLCPHMRVQVLIDAGVRHAINIDGGGSSDAVLNGKVWSRPTCQDTPEPVCERAVTSITCIKYAH